MALDRTYKDYCFYIEPIANHYDEAMAMWRAHWAEQKEEELRGVTFNPDFGGFVRADTNGLFKYITVRRGDELVGHFGLQFCTNRQTSQLSSGDEFFYLKPEHRKGLLAVKLIKFARDFAFSCGAEEFTLSYRVSVEDLDPVMRRCGMHKIAHVYQIRR